MDKKKKLEQLKRNIEYYSKVYSPNCKKVKELKRKLESLKTNSYIDNQS